MQIILLIILLITAGCGTDDPSQSDPEIDVGIYIGPGAWAPSIRAMQSALNHLGYTNDTLGAGSLLHGGASKFRIIVFPGGDPEEMSNLLGPVGRDRIRQYVSSGRGYIGLGGGAALAGPDKGIFSGLSLISSPVNWPVNRIAPYPLFAMTEIERTNSNHYIARLSSPHYTTLYHGGPEFPDPEQSNAIALYNFSVTGYPSAVVKEFGSGIAILLGFQPEFEEGSDRDSSGFGNELHDPDSEWNLIDNIVRFCIEWQR